MKKRFSEMFSRSSNIFGTVDILVNNAGINNPLMVEDMPFEVWKRVIDTDLNGAFLCSKAVIPEMKQKRHGRIINIASVAGKRISSHGSAAYTAAKAGLIGFTRHLAFELAPWGITVNAVCPGGTLSKRILERDATLSQAERDADVKRFPLGSVGKNFGTVGNSYSNCNVSGNYRVGGWWGRMTMAL